MRARAGVSVRARVLELHFVHGELGLEDARREHAAPQDVLRSTTRYVHLRTCARTHRDWETDTGTDTVGLRQVAAVLNAERTCSSGMYSGDLIVSSRSRKLHAQSTAERAAMPLASPTYQTSSPLHLHLTRTWSSKAGAYYWAQSMSWYSWERSNVRRTPASAQSALQCS